MYYKKDTDEQLVEKLIVFHLVLMTVKNMLAATIEAIYSMNSLLNIAIMGCLAICYAYVLLKLGLLRRIPKAFMLIFFGCIILFILSEIRNPGIYQNAAVRGQLKMFIAYCLPLSFLCCYVGRPELIIEKLFRYTDFMFAVASVCFLFAMKAQRASGDNTDYSMSFGYSILLISVLLVHKYVFYRKKYMLLFFLMTIAYILFACSRGPLIYIGIIVIALVIEDTNYTRKTIILLSGIVVLVLLLIFYEYIIDFVVYLFEEQGIHSRTLLLLRYGVINDDSGRGAIHKELLDAINQSPFIGLGAFGAAKLVWGAHSIFLDIIANFGYVVGMMIISIMTLFTAQYMKNNRGHLNSYYIGMLYLLSFGGGFFTGSFFESKELWMLIGIFICCSNRGKKIY